MNDGWTCTSCGTAGRDGSVFCEACGSPRPPRNPQPPNPGQTTGSEPRVPMVSRAGRAPSSTHPGEPTTMLPPVVAPTSLDDPTGTPIGPDDPGGRSGGNTGLIVTIGGIGALVVVIAVLVTLLVTRDGSHEDIVAADAPTSSVEVVSTVDAGVIEAESAMPETTVGRPAAPPTSPAAEPPATTVDLAGQSDPAFIGTLEHGGERRHTLGPYIVQLESKPVDGRDPLDGRIYSREVAQELYRSLADRYSAVIVFERRNPEGDLYYVHLLDRSFDDQEAAQAWCTDQGHGTTDHCLPRQSLS